MKLLRIALFAAALALIAILVSGTAVHAITPHEHSHGAEAVWSSLHDSLRHEDKKSLPLFYAFSILGFVALVVVRSSRAAFAPVYLGDSFEALRRGIVQYRRFR